MIVGFKDAFKLIGVSVISCCAILVCTMFVNYMIDLAAVRSAVAAEAVAFYDAQILTAKVVVAISGCCLLLTSVVTLLFYIKQYVDSHKKELGILKALGYSDKRIASNFWVFGLSVFLGTAVGFALSYAIMPGFYDVQNADKFLPIMSPSFHGELLAYFVIIPTLVFLAFSVIYACYKLSQPVIGMLKDYDRSDNKERKDGRAERKEKSFLLGLALNTLKSKKTLVFFIWFAAFCFSTMLQMGFAMRELASEMMAIMMIIIGLVLACTTLLLAITTVVNSNVKTIAIMRAYGYRQSECANAILGAYRPFAYLGFAIGSVYQYALLKIMIMLVFKDVIGVPDFKFDFAAFGITLAVFIVLYEAVTLIYAGRIRKISLRQIMSE